MRCFLCVVVAMGMGTQGAFAQSRDPSLPSVTLTSGEAQLFVDDDLIAWQSDLQRTLRQPNKDHGGNEPVIAIEDEFGQTRSTLEANGTIVYDPQLKKWVMYTLAFASNWPGESADRVRIYRFTSPDAMHWVKGDDGTPQRVAMDLYDPVSKTSATNVDLFSCMYDETDPDSPYKGWLFFANWGAGREGTYYVESPDGIRWKRGAQILTAASRTVEQDGRSMNGTGDVTTFYHDRPTGRFLGCLRWASITNVENTNRLRSRGFLFSDRLDRPIDLKQVTRLSLIPEGAQRNGDMPTDEYYSSTAWRYGSLWLGGLRIWHSRDDYPYSASGSAFLKLVVSRDGLNWKKVPFRNDDGIPEVFIPNGPEGGNDAHNDGGYMTEFSNAPLRIGDELIYYYGSSSRGKNQPRPFRVSGGGIFRARLRPDGFVSVDRGTLVTRRMKFDGRELSINGTGPIKVEVVTPSENRFTTIAEATIVGDSLSHQVVFDGKRSLRDVASDGVAQLRFTVGAGGALYSFTIDPNRAEAPPAVAKIASGPGMMKTESFDRDPGWVGVNNFSARTIEPVKIRQDFGFSPDTAHAGDGRSKEKGEMGGFMTPAGEVAFYGKAIEPLSFDQPLGASGTMSIAPGGTHLLLGFFNSASVNEWRTPNTVAIRLNGRGEDFFAYVEYCTSKWRAGGDTTPFPSVTDPATGRWSMLGFPCNPSFRWTLNYDPHGNDGKGVVTATIGEHMALCNLDGSHKQDGATFTHFGIMNVMKSADSGSEVWFDNVSINGSQAETFSRDPKWDARNNRGTRETRIVRPRFDFGFSDTNFAGGTAPGELGGQVFRGDCRYPEKMACYGDRIGPLTLDKPLRASGRIAMRRGVSDSTTLFGFYNSNESMQPNASQSDGLPESVVGIHIEGPSSEGFLFYPVLRTKGGGGRFGTPREFPSIWPDGKSHDWSMDYDPEGAEGKGRITLTLDGRSNTFDFNAGDKQRGTTFDRFGIVTSWIDGNSQDVYWDDVSYTVGQK
ncbi:MAG: hypothetical protein EXS05_13330 [Planctomycetaceae bacterium]|nr:hypothetical protein [Planctomycetaceae bacterium]